MTLSLPPTGNPIAAAARFLPLVLVASLLATRDASADTQSRADLPARLADPDPTDGRIEGDVDVVVGLGVAVGNQTVRGAMEARLRFVETAGVFLTYEDAFGDDPPAASRALTAGLELRPLFLARWLTGRELGLAWPDLVIDSFGLELGACFQQPPERPFDTQPALQAGLGLELPLLARATGPWIGVHAGARWSDTVLGGGPVLEPTDRSVFLEVTLAYHQVFATHLVDLHDRAP
jgi:hypothetical protein